MINSLYNLTFKQSYKNILKESTSNNNRTISNSQLQILADYTLKQQDCKYIMMHIWKSLNQNITKHKQIYNSLCVMDYLIKNGSISCLQEIKDEQYKIRSLINLSYQENGIDVCQKIREKAKEICQLLSDNKQLQDEREKALRIREKVNIIQKGDCQSSRKEKGFGSEDINKIGYYIQEVRQENIKKNQNQQEDQISQQSYKNESSDESSDSDLSSDDEEINENKIEDNRSNQKISSFSFINQKNQQQAQQQQQVQQQEQQDQQQKQQAQQQKQQYVQQLKQQQDQQEIHKYDFQEQEKIDKEINLNEKQVKQEQNESRQQIQMMQNEIKQEKSQQNILKELQQLNFNYTPISSQPIFYYNTPTNISHQIQQPNIFGGLNIQHQSSQNKIQINQFNNNDTWSLGNNLFDLNNLNKPQPKNQIQEKSILHLSKQELDHLNYGLQINQAFQGSNTYYNQHQQNQMYMNMMNVYHTNRTIN